MSRTPVKGNGTLYTLTDPDEYDRRTGGWFRERFPETYKLQKSMPEGRDHPQFKAFKDLALALGKRLGGDETIRESIAKTEAVEDKVQKVSRLRVRLQKAVAARKSKWVDESSPL